MAKENVDKSDTVGPVTSLSISAQEWPCHVPELPHFTGLPKYDPKVTWPAMEH